MRQIVYIAGYGRSGSTIVERMLSANEKIIGLGELAYINDSNYADLLWPKAAQDQFWREGECILRLHDNELRHASLLQLRNESVVWSFLKMLIFFSTEYLIFQHGFFTRLSSIVPDKIEYIIDSSKTARDRFGRPHALAASTGMPVKMIHLVRDPRGCLASIRKGSNNEMEGLPFGSRKALTIRVYVGWFLSNISALIYSKRYGVDYYLAVQFEALLSDPVMELARIGKYLGIDLSAEANKVINSEPIPQAPQFAGNRLRSATTIKITATSVTGNAGGYLSNLLFCILGAPIMYLMRKIAK